MPLIHKSRRKPRGIAFLFMIGLLTVVTPLTLFSIANSKAYAGTLTQAKVQIGNSQASATTSYNFYFTVANTTAIKQIDIKFCTQAGAFAATCTAPTDFSASSATRIGDNITGTGRTDSAPAANQFRSVITTPATQSPTTVSYQLTGVANPSTTNTSFFARIITYSDTGTTEIDNGQVAFAILTSTSLAVSATVNPILSFSLAAVTTGSVNGEAITITSGTSASTIPFSTLVAGTPAVAAHDATVTTNASNGYTVTASASATPPLVSGANDIDPFTGTNASPATWSEPNGSTANTNTGYFGYTTEDATLGTGTADRFTSSGGNKWAGTTITGQEVIYSATGVSSQTTRLGWQTEVNNIQPAGAYTGSVILIATPTY